MARIDQLIHRRSTETLGRRIRRRRKALRLTQAELCDAAAINQGFLSEIERDLANPSRRTLDALSVALDIPQAVLIGAGDEHDTPQPLEVKEVPLLGTIPAGQPAQSQEQLEMFPVLRHLWSADRYCLRLTFDSMEPTLKPDDIVLVRYQPNVDPAHVQGRICACLLDGKATLKRVSVEQRSGRKTIILRGDNPAAPPMIVDDERDFSIQGIVVKLVSREL